MAENRQHAVGFPSADSLLHHEIPKWIELLMLFIQFARSKAYSHNYFHENSFDCSAIQQVRGMATEKQSTLTLVPCRDSLQ